MQGFARKYTTGLVSFQGEVVVLVWFGLVFNFEVCLVSVWKLVEPVAGK